MDQEVEAMNAGLVAAALVFTSKNFDQFADAVKLTEEQKKIITAEYFDRLIRPLVMQGFIKMTSIIVGPVEEEGSLI